jgi:hypothetical protein
MSDLSNVNQHVEVIGADGAIIGTASKVEGNRIKLRDADSSSHQGHLAAWLRVWSEIRSVSARRARTLPC